MTRRSSPPHRSSRRIARRLAALCAGAAVSLAACAACSTPASEGPTTPSSGDSADASAFPVTITHAHGTTTITAKPKRVATVAFTNHEVPLALGIVPVGMSRADWDDDGDGVLPWVEDRLDELGAETPVLFDETDGIDYEAVADTRPDVILAAYSGLTEEEYNTLSKIAPVVAYPDIPWGTSVEEMITLDASALGMQEEAAALIENLRAEAKAALDAHSELEGRKLLFTHIDPTDLSQIGYYTAADPRPGYLHDLGMPYPSLVEEAGDTTEFDLTISAEEADALNDVDIVVTYGDEWIIPVLQADPLLSKVPAIAEGRIAVLPDSTPLAASASPSPLSITWGFGRYLDILAAPLSR